MSKTVQITDAILAELNGGIYSPSFTAVRAYAPTYSLEDLETLRVTVVPAARSLGFASRGSVEEEYAIDVGIQDRVANDDNAAVDALLDLAEQIGDHFVGMRLAHMQNAYVSGVEHKSFFAPDHLAELRVFTSILTLTVRLLP